MARESSRDITARLKVAGTVLFRGDLKAAEQAIKDLNKETAKGSTTSRRAAKDVDTHRKALDALGRTAARAGSIALVTSAVSALGGEAIVAVGGIGSLTGALSALPAFAIAAASGVGVLKLAFHGLGDAVKALGDPSTTVAQMKKALQGLSPQAVSFARQIVGVQAQGRVLQRAAQAAMFPGLSAGLRAAVPGLLPLARTAVTGVGGAIGRGGQILGQTLASGGVRRDLRTVVLGNNASLSTLTKGVAPATQTLARLAATIAPIEQQLASATVRGLQFLNVWTSGHTTQIRSFFEHGLHDAKEFAIGLGHLATAIGHVFGASRSANGGQDIFDGFAALTDRLSKWTGSSHGQAALTTFFTHVRDTVHDIGPGVGHIAEDIIKLGNSLSTGPFAFGVGLLSKFADLVAGLPGPIRTALVTGSALAYVGSKVKPGGIGGGLLSKVPVLGGLLGTSGALGSSGNPMYVRIVGGSGDGGGGGGTGGGWGGGLLRGLAKNGKFAGLGALGEFALPAAAVLGGGFLMQYLGDKAVGPINVSPGDNNTRPGLRGPTGALLPDGGNGPAVPPMDISHLGWYDTHYRFHVGALPQGYVRAGTGPAGSGAGGYPLYESRANRAGAAAAASIGVGLAAGKYPDLEARIADAISKAPIRVYVDSKPVAAAVAGANDRSAANR